MKNYELCLPFVEALLQGESLTKTEWMEVLKGESPEFIAYLRPLAQNLRKKYYGTDVYIRGLIEFTNYCKNDCYYCGIQKSNTHLPRYRLSKEDILHCCSLGYPLGFRTFVLQGGEDGYFTDARLVDIISSIHQTYPDCAITLSLGERSKESYQRLFDAGANRYLLRHETFRAEHYKHLHPPSLSSKHRQECLWNLKEIGYQVGTGFMVGSPGQTLECLAEDMMFLEKLNPQMVGIGPFLPHHATPFGREKKGSLETTLFLLSLIRLLLPSVLLPSTTALSSLHPKGRELGILSGGNVVMPNLSPPSVRSAYALYDNKISTEAEAAECKAALEQQMAKIGYQVVCHRGDSKNIK